MTLSARLPYGRGYTRGRTCAGWPVTVRFSPGQDATTSAGAAMCPATADAAATAGEAR